MTDDAHGPETSLSDTSVSEREAPDAEGAGPPDRPMLRVVLFVTALVVVAADQLSKMWAVAALTGRGRVPIVHDWFWFDLVRNSGAAFSFATGQTWIFTVIATIAVITIVRISARVRSRWWSAALGLLLGGATGNLIDRLVREPGIGRGHVIDFLEWPHFPVFNLADSCIVASAVLIGLLGLRGIGLDGSRSADGVKAAE